MEDIKQQVGHLIHKTRKSKGLTQSELGEKLGIGKTTINKYESGIHNITVETLKRVMDVMDVKIVIRIEP